MASFVDSISSPRSSQELPNAPSPIVPLLHGDDALSSSSTLAPPIGLPVIPGRSPRKPFVETQPPRSTFGSDHGASCNAADVSAIPRVKKPAWNVPSNSVTEPGSVMDTISWPALSESARASPKSSSYDSLRVLSEGSISALPISSVPSPSSKHALNNQNLNSAQNSSSPRGKITKDGTVTGGSSSISGASNDTLTVPSSLPALTEASQLVPGKQSSPENSPQGLPNQNNNNTDYDRDNNSKAGGFSSHSHGGNDHHRGYGGGRRGGNGHHGNYGNRRNMERGGYEWSPRNLARGFHMQQLHQQRGVGPYLRSPSATTAPFITPPPPPRPFPNHMGFPDFQSPIYYVAAPQHPESLRGIPFASHPAPTQQVMLLPAADPQCAMLLKQIDYYFSPENLCKDLYLRQNMDEQGWVPISLIAGFNRVRQLTNSIQYIIDTVQLSSVVEVQGDKIRKRNDWMAWVLHPVDSMAPASGMQFPGANFDGLAARFDNIYLDLDAPNSAELDKSEAAFARSSSAKLNGMRNSEGGDAAQASSYSDRIWNMRTLLRSDTM